MNCKNCSYIKEELDRFSYLEADEIDESVIHECWCDKLGRYICDLPCEPDEVQTQVFNKRKIKRINQYQKKKNYKKRLKMLNERNLMYPGAVIYIDKERIHKNKNGYIFTTKPYYKRIYKGNSWTESKKIGNKAVRRQKGTIYNHGAYKKVFNVWNNYI